MNKLLALLLLLLPVAGFAQQNDTIAAEDSIVPVVDTLPVIIPQNGISNATAIIPFYNKLSQLGSDFSLSKGRKVNIVLIGDSHIQADLFTDKVRKNLQRQFGNGGRGLVFPHNLAHTNGSWDIHFSSNQSWQSYRIVSPTSNAPVGLSGIALYTKSNDFAIEFNAKSAGNEFNTVKVITPGNSNSFDLATSKRTVTLESNIPKSVTHKIRNGEAISTIADKYNISIAELKKANRLKSNLIRAGKTLKIPTNEMQKRKVQRSEFIPLELQSDAVSHFYQTDASLDKIYLLPSKAENLFALNGLVLENKSSGVIFHNIGVNGAKLSDYNKYPLFFEQLKALQADLVIVSLGTNESFDKMDAAAYMIQLNLFLDNVRKQNSNAAIMVLTPPPSLFKRKYPNTFVASYAEAILENASVLNYAVWNMYAQIGGVNSVNRNYNRGLMAGDRVHYSKAGYELQGDLLSQAIIESYKDYLKNRD